MKNNEGYDPYNSADTRKEDASLEFDPNADYRTEELRKKEIAEEDRNTRTSNILGGAEEGFR